MKSQVKSDSHSYDDIIQHSHYVYAKHPPMPLEKRAEQFAPFDALEGYGGMLSEAFRRVDPKLDLSEEDLRILNDRLNYLVTKDIDTPICVMYFVPDIYKQGGTYQYQAGIIRRVDTVEQKLIFTTGEVIRFEDIYRIDGPQFNI